MMKTPLPNPVTNPELETLFKPTRVRKAGVLTTTSLFTAQPALEPVNASAVAAADVAKREFSAANTLAAFAGSRPLKLTPFAWANDFQPVSGVYIVAAATGSGKTALCLGLSYWANAVGIPASLSYVFEPRSVPIKTDTKTIYAESQKFIEDTRVNIRRTHISKVAIIDSATIPIKAYSGITAFKGQSTFTGGSQPSDFAFLNELSKIAYNAHACIIITLNSTLIRYVSDLEGVIEGVITINDVMHFTVKDRTTFSSRQQRAIKIPLEFVNAALDTLGYDKYNKSSNSSGRLGFSGI